MFAQQNAIAKLLRDDDARTVGLVKEQLARQGSAALPSLADMLTMYDERVTAHVKDVMARINAEKSGEDLTRLCRDLGESDDLEPFCWLLARAMLPGVEIEPSRLLLDEWSRQIAKGFAPSDDGEDRVLLLSGFIGSQLGFRGNADDYYNRDNSLLPRIIATRLGIPITLSLLYMFIGRRIGLRVEGVNFPNHFLARHDGTLFDPFHRGRIVGLAECRQFLAARKLELEPDHLDSANSIVIAQRVLANLLYVHQGEKEAATAAKITGWLHALDR